MHQKSDWGKGMHRTDSYWRPPGGCYHTGGNLGRSWTAYGRFQPHAYPRYSDQYSKRHSDHRSYGTKWRDHSNHYRDHNSHRGNYSASMAPGQRKGRGRGRGGSRPFPSKLMSSTDSTSHLNSTGLSLHSNSLSSVSSKHDADAKISSSSNSSSSSVSSPCKSFGANDSSRPDQKNSKKDPRLTHKTLSKSFKHSTPNVPNMPFTFPILSSHLDLSSSASSTPNFNAESEPPKSSDIAQSYTVSVSSSNHQRLKFSKRSDSCELSSIPLSTLEYCHNIPFLKSILRKKPVVVLEKLTEKLIRKKLEYAGLHLCGNLHKLLLNKKQKKKHLHNECPLDKRSDAGYKAKSLKLVFSVNSNEMIHRKSQHGSARSPESEHDPDTSDDKSKALLVDPKVISLSRPLQTAYSNNTSKTNTPFKHSGRGKNPSKPFSTKLTGSVPRHMQIFDLDKLRTKLKGANFGGSRKPRQVLHQHQGVCAIKKDSLVTTQSNTECPLSPDTVYSCTTSPADTTKELKPVDTASALHDCTDEVSKIEYDKDVNNVDEFIETLHFNVEVKENYENQNLTFDPKGRCGSQKESENHESQKTEENEKDIAAVRSFDNETKDNQDSHDQDETNQSEQHDKTHCENKQEKLDDTVSEPHVYQMQEDHKDSETMSLLEKETIIEEKVCDEENPDLSNFHEEDVQSNKNRFCNEPSVQEQEIACLKEDTQCSQGTNQVTNECDRAIPESPDVEVIMPHLQTYDTAESDATVDKRSPVNISFDCHDKLLTSQDGNKIDSATEQERDDQGVIRKMTGFDEIMRNDKCIVIENHCLEAQSNNPSKLVDICQKVISKNHKSIDNDSTSNTQSSEDFKASNELEESNSMCLRDMESAPPSSDANAAERAEDQDDTSPMCIITSVESAAHIYFSEGASDLNSNSVEKKPEDLRQVKVRGNRTVENKNIEVTNVMDLGQPSKETQVGSVPSLNNLALQAANQVSTSNQDLYAPSITTQVSVLIAPAVPIYPVPLGQPVLSQQDSPPHSKQEECKLSCVPVLVKPQGREPIETVMTSEVISPGSLFPMMLPTVPTEYQYEHFTVDNHTNVDVNESAKDSESSTQTAQECSQPVFQGSSDGDVHARHASDVASSICENIQYPNEMSTMVSDLDVMHYEEEDPPVLQRIGNTNLKHTSQSQELVLTASSIPPVEQTLSIQTENRSYDTTFQLSSDFVHKKEYCEPGSLEDESNCQPENNLQTVEADVDELSLKTENDYERVEVGRLNLRRAQGDGSEDSDATLIYSCDEDNTCFEEIFQDAVNQTWPRSAPWTDNDDTKTPSLYEGKLVIMSDLADDGEVDGESTSDTNTSNERLSLIITTLRKDLEEKKSDRRQAERNQSEDNENTCEEEANTKKSKGRRKRVVKSRRKAILDDVPSGEVTEEGDVTKTLPVKKSKYKKRENLIVTIQRRMADQDMPSTNSSEDVANSLNESNTDEKRTNLKNEKPKRRIKRRLTVRRKKKKGGKQSEENPVPETLKEEDSKQKKKKTSNIRAKKRKLIVKLKGKKKDKKIKTLKVTETKPKDPVDSDDSDELPTILPPKRRRLLSNGNPLVMMQNSIGKGNSSERIMREFPRHNWLEQKINQLQQQPTCSSTPEDDLSSQNIEQQPHVQPCTGEQENAVETTSDASQSTDATPDLNSNPTEATENETETVLPEGTEKELPTTEPSASDVNSVQDSFSLQEAIKLVGAEDSEGNLVIDESQFENKLNVTEDIKSENVNTVSTQNTGEENMSSVSPESKQETFDSSLDNNEKGDCDTATKLGGIGSPLDLCVRKTEKSSGGNGRQKSHPPVQMVLPQIQQPARPISTDPVLVKETKEIVQNVVVLPQSDEETIATVSDETQHTTETEALNLSKPNAVSHPQDVPTNLAELVEGVVIPAVTQVEGVNTVSSNENRSMTPSNMACQDPSLGQSSALVPQSLKGSSHPVTHVEIPSVSSVNTVPTSASDRRVDEISDFHPGPPVQAPSLIPCQGTIPVSMADLSRPHPHLRPSNPSRNIEGHFLDKEFEKHLKEFKHLEMLAAKKEREREALLHLKKRKAMLLKEMKYLKTHQNSDTELNRQGPPPAHDGNQYGSHHVERPHFQTAQHRTQVAELRPFPQQLGHHQQSHHPMYSASSMSQTLTSPSNKTGVGPLNLEGSIEGSAQRKRHSDDRRPIVQMINLAMLQKGRKLRRLNDEHRGSGTGGNSSGTIPTPAHQNRTETVVNHDADVPSSEITHCPYIKRKTPILEPPGSSRSIPATAALIPAHSQQPFQTAGSLIVPARNGPEENQTPPYPHINHFPTASNVSPTSQSQIMSRPSPTQTQHRNTALKNVQSEPKSRIATEAPYNVHNVSHNQPMSYSIPAERNVVNTNPNTFPPDQLRNTQPHWSPRMPNQFSNNTTLHSHQLYPSMQVGPQGLHQNIRQPPPLGMRPERSTDVIDLTKEQNTSTSEMLRHMPVTMAGPGEVPAESESTVQRELTAALARRHGFEQPQQMIPRRNQDITHANYNAKPYPGQSLGSQQVQQHPHPSQMFSPTGSAQTGNMMTSSTDPSFQMQSRPGAISNHYRMQEPSSVKSALLAHGAKMVCPPSYPMNTSAPVNSYPSVHYQQPRSMKLPQTMTSSAPPLVEGYPQTADKNPMMPGQLPHQQPIPTGFNEHMARGGQSRVGQLKSQQNWRPQVPTSVSSVPMSYEKQQQLMMMTRKTQWEQFQQQKQAMAQKNHSLSSTSQGMHTGVSAMPHTGGANYAMAQAANQGNPEHGSMQQRAAMHQHNMRMMQHPTAPVAAQMHAKMQQRPTGYPREPGMMIPGQTNAPALIEFQQQESHRRMQQMPLNQPPPKLHQFNGSCVVCGALAMYLCSSCRMVWYCSQTCQNNHWKRHGPECKPVQKPGIPGQI